MAFPTGFFPWKGLTVEDDGLEGGVVLQDSLANAVPVVQKDCPGMTARGLDDERPESGVRLQLDYANHTSSDDVGLPHLVGNRKR